MTGIRPATGTLILTLALIAIAGGAIPIGADRSPAARASSAAAVPECGLAGDVAQASPSADTLSRQVAGGPTTSWQTIDVPDAGFSISVPPDWTAVDMTRDDLETMIEWMAESNPELGRMLEAFAADVTISLVAISPISPDDPFIANINVIRQPNIGMSPSMIRSYIEAMLKDVPNLLGQVASEDVMVAGQPGYHIAYALSLAQPDGSSLVYCVDQYAAVTDTALWSVTYSDDVRTPELSERIIGTLVVAPAEPDAAPS